MMKTTAKAASLLIAGALGGGVAARVLAPIPLASAQDKGPGAPGGDTSPARAKTYLVEVFVQGIADLVRFHHVTEWKIIPAGATSTGTPGFMRIDTADGKRAFFATDKVVYFETEEEDEAPAPKAK